MHTHDGSSTGPPGSCMTPSSVPKVRNASFLVLDRLPQFRHCFHAQHLKKVVTDNLCRSSRIRRHHAIGQTSDSPLNLRGRLGCRVDENRGSSAERIPDWHSFLVSEPANLVHDPDCQRADEYGT